MPLCLNVWLSRYQCLTFGKTAGENNGVKCHRITDCHLAILGKTRMCIQYSIFMEFNSLKLKKNIQK